MKEELKTKIFKNLEKKYTNIPIEIINRVNDEIKFINDNNYEIVLSDLLDIKEILNNIFLLDLNTDKEVYTITQSINDLFIAYILNITEINPLDYNIEIPKKIKVGINLPEGLKLKFLNYLAKKFPNKVKLLNNYSYFVIDHDDELDSFNVKGNLRIIKINKGEIVLNKNILIYIDEKRILTILNNIYKYLDVDIKYDSRTINLLKQKYYDTTHLTTFEYDVSNDIRFQYMSEYKKCFEITYTKYFYPRIYYFEVIKYMMQEINKDILNYYKDNYDLAIAYYQNKTRILFEEEYILQFYQICKDAKRLFLKFKLDIKNLIPVISNITFLDCRVGNGMVKVLYEIAKYKAKNNKVIIFTFDGNSDFYLASFISQESSIDYKEVLSFINPLYYKKTNKDNINKIIKSILKIQNISIYLNNHSLFDDIIKCKDYDVIIIDSLDYLLRQTNYSLNKTLKILNSLNKELIIFERPKNKYKVYDDITIKDIKYYTIKKKYAENFYSFKKNNKIVIKNMFGGDNYEI